MYKTIVLLLISVLSLTSITVFAQDNDPNMGIIPAPVSVKKADGQFVLSQETVLYADSNTKAVSFFTDYLQNKLNLRTQLKIGDAGSAASSIVLTAKGTENLPNQGYRLTITPQQIIIAGKGAGLFYGIQTVLQLIPADRAASIKIPCGQIEDYPRFGYRLLTPGFDDKKHTHSHQCGSCCLC